MRALRLDAQANRRRPPARRAAPRRRPRPSAGSAALAAAAELDDRPAAFHADREREEIIVILEGGEPGLVAFAGGLEADQGGDGRVDMLLAAGEE